MPVLRTDKAASPAADRDYYLITGNFDDLHDPSEQHFFENLPTNFHLPGATVDRLHRVPGSPREKVGPKALDVTATVYQNDIQWRLTFRG